MKHIYKSIEMEKINIIARIDKGMYVPHMNLLIEKYNFLDFTIRDKREKRIVSKLTILKDVIAYMLIIFKNLKYFRRANILVCAGWIALPVKLLIKLKIVRCNKFLWLGFQIHTPKLYPFFKILLQLLNIKNEVYIVNAKYEIDIYVQQLKLKPSKLKHLPYGDWSEIKAGIGVDVNQLSDYYFAGGYTNRDYQSLIEVFTKLDKKLVIVGSRLNKDLHGQMPENITIKKDVNRKEFSSYVKQAKVCIMPLRHYTGASGQMVLLNYMKNGKAVLASNEPSVREYVKDRQSAILFDNIKEELPAIIEEIDNSPELIERLGNNIRDRYIANFGKESLSKQFEAIVFANTEVKTHLTG